MNVLLVEPDYYTTYPPLGLLKLASYHRAIGDNINYVRGIDVSVASMEFDKIEITSLFTYAWEPVHKAIRYYHNIFPKAEIEVGGIYATLMPDHIKSTFPFVKVFKGLHPQAENYVPAYDILKKVDKWKDWNKSILFSSRGCIRKCPFCIVPKMEGKYRAIYRSVMDFVYPGHKTLVLWDNNFLVSPFAKEILTELIEHKIKPDLNQGIDARLMTDEIAELLVKAKPETIHMAYDWVNERPYIYRAVEMLSKKGYSRREMIFYTLYNFYDPVHKHGDTPDDFLKRLKDLMQLGVCSYPMRFTPLDSLEKNKFVSPLWTEKQLDLVVKARSILGFGGALIPYDYFKEQVLKANTLEEAFRFDYLDKNKKSKKSKKIR